MLHLYRDHYQIRNCCQVDQGHHLHLLHHHHLCYGMKGSLHGGMDNSSDSVEAMVIYIFATVVGAERFEMTSSLTLKTNALSHMCGKNFVDK
jgi:hypothetical protein